MVRLSVKFLFLGFWLSGVASASDLASAYSSVDSFLPVALPDLVQGSDRIFVGTVASIDPPDSGHAYQIVTFQIEYVLKGPGGLGRTLTLHQSEALKIDLFTGERVLWFLAPDDQEGYTLPFGFRAGDFRVDSGEYAINRVSNRGLWADDGQLWDGSECSRKRFVSSLYRSSASNKTVLQYLRWADSPYVPQAYPIHFLTFAAMSCLTGAEFQKIQIGPFPRTTYREESRRRN